MPISVDSYDALAGQVLELYGEAERVMCERVARRLQRGVTEPGWTERKLAETQAMSRELTSLVDGLQGQRQGMTDRFVRDAYAASSQAFVSDATRFARAAGIESLSPNSVKVINILADMNNCLNAADRAILRRADDAYADVIGRASALMATGTITSREAVQSALDQFANRGIGSFVDRAGRTWDMATYAEMAALTAIERATIAGYVDTMREYGFDLAQISSHHGACPLCEAWEGVVVSVSGETRGYPTLDEAEGAGCFHPRCLHTISTYYGDLSGPARREPRDVAEPSAGYSARTEQRAAERAERLWKRRMAVACSPEAERRAYARVRMYQERIRRLIGDYNAGTDAETDRLSRKWYREGGRVRLSEAARRLKPFKIATQ